MVATAILDDSFDYDANGNVTDITDQAQAGLTTRGMAYDGLDRLITVVAPGPAAPIKARANTVMSTTPNCV